VKDSISSYTHRGTIPREPPIRLLSMPAPTMLYTFAFELLLIDTLRILHYRSPLRISSLPAGEPLRPGIYFIIEDVVAVDGGGGTAYRERLNERYEKSHLFRQMLHRLTLFWAGGAAGMAVVCTVVVFTVPGSVAYAVSLLFYRFDSLVYSLGFSSAGQRLSYGRVYGLSPLSSGYRRI
jgi:hypothetical protein